MTRLKSASSVSVVLPGQGHPIISQEGLGNLFAEKVFIYYACYPRIPHYLMNRTEKEKQLLS